MDPSPSSSLTPSTGPQIRSRITVVCAECKRLKLKCDRRIPCGSCTKRNTVARCIYSPAAAEKIDIQSLHNRLIQVESTLSQLTAGFSSSTHDAHDKVRPRPGFVLGEASFTPSTESVGSIPGKPPKPTIDLFPVDDVVDIPEYDPYPPLDVVSPITASSATLVDKPSVPEHESIVCAECKRLKLKCDRRTPCGSCTKRNTVARCIYSPAVAEKVDLHFLNNRLLQVESTLSRLTAGASSSTYDAHDKVRPRPGDEVSFTPRTESVSSIPEEPPKPISFSIDLFPVEDLADPIPEHDPHPVCLHVDLHPLEEILPPIPEVVPQEQSIAVDLLSPDDNYTRQDAGTRASSTSIDAPPNVASPIIASSAALMDRILPEHESTVTTPTPHFSLIPLTMPLPSISHTQSDVYARQLLQEGHGYPLWHPEPLDVHPAYYRARGVSVGDVGLITSDGAFDYIFNICSPRDHPSNHAGVPFGFDPVFLGPDDMITKVQQWSPGAYISNTFKPDNVDVDMSSQGTSSILKGFQFSSSSKEGSILVLPDGASRFDLLNQSLFVQYAQRHGSSWYNLAHARLGRTVPNGSLLLVTGCDMAISWGAASFSLPSETHGVSLKFTAAENEGEASYQWKWEVLGPQVAMRTGPKYLGQAERRQNQCVFVRGYKLYRTVTAPATPSVGRPKMRMKISEFTSIAPFRREIMV